MDDDEMGRPGRHERKHAASRGSFFGDALQKGSEPVVRVHGEVKCEGCGTPISVDFTGPSDSLGAKIATARLRDRQCPQCLEILSAQEATAEREQRRLGAVRKRLVAAQIPDAWMLSLDDLQPKTGQETAIELAGKWASGDIRALMLHGPVGTGKTLISAAAATSRCVVSAVRWVSVARLLMDLTSPFGSLRHDHALRTLEVGTRGMALVLDDLDKVRATEYALQPLYVAINGWLEARQPLIVNMNRDLDEFAAWAGETFGAPLASRLAGYCEVVQVSGPDWRLE